MTETATYTEILSRLSGDDVKMGDIKKIAKEIKKDHALALELWASQQFHARMLAVLIMDKKLIDQPLIDQLVADLETHNLDEQQRIIDWFLANQLMKSKKTIALLNSWEDASAPLLRRLFWYHQARLRWTGKTPPGNTPALIASLETEMAHEEPEVQWAMNFTAGQIGIYEIAYRDQLIALGERVGLYKDDPVSYGCTPNYLPEFIRIEAEKLEKEKK